MVPTLQLTSLQLLPQRYYFNKKHIIVIRSRFVITAWRVIQQDKTLI